MSITNENPEERFAALAESYEARLSKQVNQPRVSSRTATEVRQKAPVIAPTKNKSRRSTGNLENPPAMTKTNRWDSPVVVTSTQAIADSGSVWIKAQNKAGELLSIRYDGASDSLKGGHVTINGEALPVEEKAGLLAAIAKATVPYAGELVLKRIQQHMGMFCERAANYEG